MAQKTKIKEDSLGLYVIAGGYFSRTYKPTRFKVGDEVVVHHFGGSQMIGVGEPGTKFNVSHKHVTYEIWTTTIVNYDYVKARKLMSKDQFEEYARYVYKQADSSFDLGEYSKWKGIIESLEREAEEREAENHG